MVGRNGKLTGAISESKSIKLSFLPAAFLIKIQASKQANNTNTHKHKRANEENEVSYSWLKGVERQPRSSRPEAS
jgi:hypothetical protein